MSWSQDNRSSSALYEGRKCTRIVKRVLDAHIKAPKEVELGDQNRQKGQG